VRVEKREEAEETGWDDLEIELLKKRIKWYKENKDMILKELKVT